MCFWTTALFRATDNSTSRLPPLWIGCVAMLGVALSLTLFLAVRGWEQRERESMMAGLVREQVEKLQATMLRSMEVLYSIASLHQSEGRIEREPFSRFVRQALNRQPELQALSWNPLVQATRRAEFEKAATASGLAEFEFREQAATGRLVPERTRPDYVPVYFIEPIERNAAALGFDLNSDPVRRESVEQARDTGKAVATAPIRLAQESNNQAGILVLLPVYRGATPTNITERREQLDGYAVAVFRVADLVATAFHNLKVKGIETRLFDQSPGGEKLFSSAKVADTSPSLGRLAWLEVASRRWAVVFTPTPEFKNAHAPWQSWLVFGAGLAFTLLTTAYLYGGWRRTRLVAAANDALQQEVAVRQQAEAAAESANQAKSDFLASMSHEIRTPLNAILGYAQLMQRDPQLSGEQKDAIHGISTSGHHLLGLINEVLDLSKIEAGRMELNLVDFDLDALGRSLATTFKPLCARKRIGFRVEAGSHGSLRVRGDEGKLRQVLINLLGNAVKFTQAGEVCLRFRSSAGGAWHFEVIDTGLGIPESEQAEIFKPFHQGSGAQHQGGTGLGLAIAQRQVELLGGQLEVQSERGIGSRFHFTISLGEPAGAVEAIPRQVARLSPGTRLVALVVDDRLENREVLGRMLSVIGCEVFSAVGGDTALHLAREHKPDIVFVDLLLPGMSSREFTRELLADPACGRPKIIAHSASPLVRHQEEAFESGCADFIAKPFGCEQLYDRLKRHLGVTYDYAEPDHGTEALPETDLASISLPEELCARLMVGAELHSTTALKAALQELRQLGPDAQRLAEHIRQLMRSYDMDGVQRLLARIAMPESFTPLASTHHGSSDQPRADA